MSVETNSRKIFRKFRYAALGMFVLGCSAGTGDSLEGESVVDPSVEGEEGVESAAGNLIANPSFETDTKGWYSWQGVGARVVLADAPSGAAVAKVTRKTGTKYSLGTSSIVSSVAKGAAYKATASVKAASASAVGKSVKLVIRARNSAGDDLTSWSSAKLSLSSKFQTLSISTTNAPTGSSLEIYVVQDSAVAGDAFYADAFTFSLVGTTPLPVADAGSPPPAVDSGVTPPPSSTGNLDTLFGASFQPHDAAGHDALNSLFGTMGMTRSFDGSSGVNPFINSYQPMDIARNAVSAYSFKYPPLDVITGKHDADLTRFFQAIKDDHVTYWTYWHEPDDEMYKTNTFTPTQYRDAWAHIKTIANGVKASRPKMIAYATLIIMEYSMTPPIAPSRPLLGANGMYPGDNVIDVFGVDVYNTGTESSGNIKSPDVQFGKVIDFAEAHGKKWAIGEFGSCPVKGNPNGRATYLSQAISYWKSRNNAPVYAAYFNLEWPTCDYRLENDAAATAVWKKAVTQGVKAF